MRDVWDVGLDWVQHHPLWVILAAGLLLCVLLWRWRHRRRLPIPIHSLSQVKTPRQFEAWTAAFFAAQGKRATLTPPSRDGGYDVLLRKRRRRELVECKHYQGTVPIKEVRALMGVVAREKAAHGYLVTTGSFSPQAHAEVRGQPITLIDGVQLQQNAEGLGMG